MLRAWKLRLAELLAATGCCSIACYAQELAPRAYLVTPVDSHALTLTYAFQNGTIETSGAPITDAQGRISVPVLSYYTTFGLLGRSANFTVGVPYGVANFSGNVAGEAASLYRSGLMDSHYRLSVNLIGGRAMSAPEFRSWRQKTLLGASLTVVAPTGQYDPVRLVNYSARHWAFRPEIGLSRRWRNWVLDFYGAVWWFTANRQVYPERRTRTERPIGALETHLSYEFKQRLWVSADGNFWRGGTTGLNGVERPLTRQQSSRVGVTASVPVNEHQSFKFSYSDGAYVTYGGKYQNISIAWQYSWIVQPR